MLVKLGWYKESESSKQLEDVRSIIKISGNMLDLKYLKLWAKKLGLTEILNRIIEE
jgi:hypothetical protein